ncbi:MAG: hypothetical protein ACR2IF_11145 [Terriglobales bacterium]
MKTRLILALLALTLLTGQVFADQIFSFSGTTSGGLAAGATADFSNFTASGFDVTLTNTSNVQQIGQTLTGISFGLTSAPGGVSLGAVTPTSIWNCGNTGCAAGSGTSPYFWGTSKSSGSTVALEAGTGTGGTQWHPFEIVNSSIFASCTGTVAHPKKCLDGLGNSEHNPYLMGPVLFHVNLTGYNGSLVIPGDVTFYFNTNGENGNGTCTRGCTPPRTPEPGAMSLLAAGFLGVAALFRRKLGK